MINSSYLIQQLILHLILAIFAFWGLHYATSKIANHFESVMVETTQRRRVGL